MSGELLLPVNIRANSKAQFRVLTRTVEEGIDAIHALPDEIRFKPHWSKAEEALFKAVEGRAAPDLRDANMALQDALKQEGWLRVTDVPGSTRNSR